MGIITLQFGHYANHVGSLFWNQQLAEKTNQNEEVDSSLLWREATSSKISDATPRLLAFDLKGAHNVQNVSDPTSIASSSAWEGEIENYTQIDSGATQGGWHPLCIPPLDRNSLCEVHEYLHEDVDNQPFDYFHQGYNLVQDFRYCDQYLDEQLRRYTEECDFLHGFQVLTELNGGFSGFSTAFLEQVAEEYPKSPIITFGLNEIFRPLRHSSKNRKEINAFNVAQSFRGLNSVSSLLIPLDESKVSKMNPFSIASPIEASSAILSSFVSTMTTHYRLSDGMSSMSQFCDTMNWRKDTKIAEGSMILPLHFQEDLECTLKSFRDSTDFIHLFNSSFTTISNPYVMSVCGILKGIPKIPLYKGRISGNNAFSSSDDMLYANIAHHHPGYSKICHIVKNPCVLDGKKMASYGEMVVSTKTADTVDAIIQSVREIDSRILKRLETQDDMNDMAELVNDLYSIKESYCDSTL